MKSLSIILASCLLFSSCSIDWNDEKNTKILTPEESLQQISEKERVQNELHDTLMGMQCMYAFSFQDEEFRKCELNKSCEDEYFKKKQIELRTGSEAVESCVKNWKEREKELASSAQFRQK